MGEKPFYWALDNLKRFIFASEIKAIIAGNLVSPNIDFSAVHAYMNLSYIPPRRTVYSNSNVLPPAHSLIWKDFDIKIWKYWEPSYSTVNVDDDTEIIEHTRELIDQAVKRQMVSDVPVGAFLSGGRERCN
jgi:asparagine synthase (glutamine-hydrolysing)